MAGFSRNVFSFSCSSSKVVMLLFFFFISFSEARDHLIGGKIDAWKIPSSPSSLNNWSSKTRFLIGDSLLWKYDGKTDSVLQVSKKDYVTCNTSAPVGAHSDGDTKIVLDHSGPYYFISGAEGHCRKGQKLIVVVLSEKHSRMFLSPAAAPSPAEELGAPAVAPTTGGSQGLKAGFVLGLALFVGLFMM